MSSKKMGVHDQKINPFAFVSEHIATKLIKNLGKAKCFVLE